MLAYLVLVCGVSSLVSNVSAWKWGPCPRIPLQENFELQSYLGEWREAARMIGTPFESGNCCYAKYSLKENGHLKINNTEILEDGTTIPQLEAPTKLRKIQQLSDSLSSGRFMGIITQLRQTMTTTQWSIPAPTTGSSTLSMHGFLHGMPTTMQRILTKYKL